MPVAWKQVTVRPRVTRYMSFRDTGAHTKTEGQNVLIDATPMRATCNSFAIMMSVSCEHFAKETHLEIPCP